MPASARPILNRRQALSRLAVGGAAVTLGLGLRPVRAASPSPARLRLAFWGVGGRGRANVYNLADHQAVAFADVDDVRAAEIYEKFPGVPRYRDHRVLLDRHAHEIDGIVISTPDHWHLDMGLAAIRAGKHVYLEKPLAPTIWECRELRKAAAASGVITQFGAQGHSFEALQVLREWVDAGVVGAIHAVHLWTDRMRTHDYVAADEPLPGQAVPPTFDWEQWLGPRRSRPYHPGYAPSRWRNWWDFGAGAVTDIGVHMFDVLQSTFDLGVPDSVTAEGSPPKALTAPEWARVVWRFPARDGRGPLAVTWLGGFDGGAVVKPDAVPGLSRELVQRTDSGMAFVGTEGTLFIPDMRASSRPRIYPEAREREVLASPPPRTRPRPKGGHWQDWTDAILAGRPASAPLAYGAEVTETVLLGALALRSRKEVRWLPEAMRCVDNPAADAWVTPANRPGWSPGA